MGTAQAQLPSLTPVPLVSQFNPPNTPLPSQSPGSGRRNHLLKGQFAAKSPVLNKAEPLMLHFHWGSNTSAAASSVSQQQQHSTGLAEGGKGLRHKKLQRQQREQETTAEAVTGSCSLRGHPGQCHLSVPCPLTPTAAHTCPQGPFTFLLPPPGTWLMLSRDPIFDCTLSLKSSFSDFTSTWPPPAGEQGEVAQSWSSTQHCGAHWGAPVLPPPSPCPSPTPLSPGVPGLWWMLPREPHLDVTWLRSTGL